MSNTYTQIHVHAVFAVKHRVNVIQNEWKDNLYKYITGIVQMNKHKMLIINGMPDHLHILFGMRPTQSLSDLIQDVKGSSSKWINDQGLTRARFEWQEGFGAFTYSKSQIDRVITYIQNQENHHKTQTFIDEYRDILKRFEIDYDERYIFKTLE